MRKLIFTLLLLPLAALGQSANDLIITQRKSDGTGNIQRNVTAGASALLGFSSSTIPVKVTIGSGLSFDTGTNTLSSSGGAGVSDGDKGDITVSGSGATWTIDTGAVSLSKLADMATASLLGRSTAGTGVPEVLSAATVRSILDLEAGTDFLAYPTGTPNGSKFLRDDNTWQAIPGGGDALTSSPLSQFAATTSAQLAGVISDETGSGALVLASSPTLTTPNLGTPSALTLTNATGLPISTGVSGLGANVATALATPSSANVAAAITDETGSGALVFGTSPAFTTNLTLATSATPTTTTAGTIAFDTDAWGASRGAPQVYDGTANIVLLGTQASDAPTNGQVPTWNTGGTITWETPATGNVTNNATLTSGNVIIGGGTTVVGTSNVSWNATNNTLTAPNLTVTSNGTFGNVTATNFDLSGASITGTISVTNGGTGRATGTTAYSLIATGTTATGAQQTLANGATTEILVGGGASALPVWTTATGSGAPVRAVSPTLTGTTILDPGSGTLPDVITNAQLRLAQADGTANGIQSDSWGLGTGLQLQSRRSGGTRASPTATDQVTILDVLAYGHNGTAYTTSPSARYQITAPSTWSGSNQETNHVWIGTPNASTTAATWMTLSGTGLSMTRGAVTLGTDATTAGTIKLFGGTSGNVTISPTAAAGSGVTLTLPAATDTLVGKATTDVFTNKTFDASATGNVLKQYGYLILTHPTVFGSGVTQQTTVTSPLYGQALFSNSADKATNYVEYILTVPDDIDTSVDLTGKFKFVLGGADTGDHEYEISMLNVADSAVYDGALGNAVSLTYTADGSGADKDVETAGAPDTLTGWAAALTAGRYWRIRVARDGDNANDGSTVNSYSGPLVIRYGITQ